jgi:hypothetical protein
MYLGLSVLMGGHRQTLAAAIVADDGHFRTCDVVSGMARNEGIDIVCLVR